MYKSGICVVWCSMLWYAAYPIPISFERFVQLNTDGKIIKTVDLIGDAHKPFREIVNQPSRKRALGEEKSYFTTAERTLVSTLRSLGERAPTKTLLWEYPHIDMNSMDTYFLLAGGNLLQNDLKNTFVSFIDCDTYRSFLEPELRFLLGARDVSNGPLATFQEKLIQLTSIEFPPFQQDLVRAKQVSQDQSDWILKEWQFFIKTVKSSFLQKILDPYLQQNTNATLQDFKSYIEKNAQVEKIFDKLILELLMEFETVFKLMSFETSHSIVYAGAAHGVHIASMLDKGLHYSKVITIMPPSISGKERFFLPLSTKTWQYLTEDAQKSVTRYKQFGKKPLSKNIEVALIHEFIALFDALQAGALSDEAALMRLKDLFLKADKTFFNLLEARENALGETLLYGAIKHGLKETVTYLINKGARLTIRNNEWKSPLHYAALLPDPAIFTMILDRVDTYFKDKEGKTAFAYINPLWKNQLPALLKKKNQKELRTLKYYLKSFNQDLDYLEKLLIS